MSIYLDFASNVAPGCEEGEPPELRGDESFCPKCGAEAQFGYGLIGGGCGVYAYCSLMGCDWFWKRQDSE